MKGSSALRSSSLRGSEEKTPLLQLKICIAAAITPRFQRGGGNLEQKRLCKKDKPDSCAKELNLNKKKRSQEPFVTVKKNTRKR